MPGLSGAPTFQQVKTFDSAGAALTAINGGLPTARKFTSLILLNALAITDTTEHQSATLDVSGITGRKTITLFTTLNQPITGVGLWLFNGTSAQGPSRMANFTAQTIGAAGAYLSTAAAATGNATTALVVPFLDEPWNWIIIGITCAVAPTSGSVTVTLGGES